MLHRMFVFHQNRVDSPYGFESLPAGWFHWETCLRRVVIGEDLGVLRSTGNEQVYRGEAGYNFLLELICGLHSPVVGETEVLGQFRESVDRFIAENPKGFMPALSQKLYQDAKFIREKYLTGIGLHSYGSLLRKKILGFRHVHVLGAGQLTQEILPWLRAEGRLLSLSYRSLAGASRLYRNFPELQLNFYRSRLDFSIQDPAALVISAPMSAGMISNCLGPTLAKFDLIVDFRADSHSDILPNVQNIIQLQGIFAEMEQNSSQIQGAVANAKAAILACTRRRYERIEAKPFGWEDVCA